MIKIWLWIVGLLVGLAAICTFAVMPHYTYNASSEGRRCTVGYEYLCVRSGTARDNQALRFSILVGGMAAGFVVIMGGFAIAWDEQEKTWHRDHSNHNVQRPSSSRSMAQAWPTRATSSSWPPDAGSGFTA